MDSPANCGRCGFAVAQGAAFCTNCGASVSGSTPEEGPRWWQASAKTEADADSPQSPAENKAAWWQGKPTQAKKHESDTSGTRQGDSSAGAMGTPPGAPRQPQRVRFSRTRSVGAFVAVALTALLVGSGIYLGLSVGEPDDGTYLIVSATSPPDTSILADPDAPIFDESGSLSPDAFRILTIAAVQSGLELYRRDHGFYPEQIDALFPDYAPLGQDGAAMTEVPQGPKGEPLQYSTESGSYSLSMAMENGSAYVVTGGDE